MSIQEDSSPSKEPKNPESPQFLIAEYNALREEILKRIELQHQLIALAIISFGTILGAGIQNHNASLILLYPALATFLSASWVTNFRRGRQIGAYLRVRIEARIEASGLGWEHFFESIQNSHHEFLSLWASKGIFLGTQLLAIAVAIPLGKFDTLITILLIAAITSFMLTGILLRQGNVKDVPSIDQLANLPHQQPSSIIKIKSKTDIPGATTVKEPPEVLLSSPEEDVKVASRHHKKGGQSTNQM